MDATIIEFNAVFKFRDGKYENSYQPRVFLKVQRDHGGGAPWYMPKIEPIVIIDEEWRLTGCSRVPAVR